jgi:hypothetical protein
VVGRVAKVEMTFFIAVEGGSHAVRGGWAAVVVTPHVSKPHDYVNHMFMRL